MTLSELKVKVDQAIKDYGRGIGVCVQDIPIEDCFIEIKEETKNPEDNEVIMRFHLGQIKREYNG